MRYLLGIDIGGTALKACIFDENGNLCASAGVSTPVISNGDFQERDMNELEDMVFDVIRRSIEAFDGGAENIVCIGSTGHGKGLYPLDGNKKIFCNAIASTDRRAEGQVEYYRKNGIEDRAKTLSFQPLMACEPAPLLRWFKENDRTTYDMIGSCMSAKDFIRYILTDEIRYEESDSSGTALVNLKTRKFDEELFKMYGIEEKFSAYTELITCTDIAGRVTPKAAERTGLRAGTPVCGGMFDIDACALSCGEISDSDISVIVGTWSINQYPASSPNTGCASTKVSLYCDGRRYLIEESSPTSAGNLEWCTDKLFDKLSYREIDEIAEKYSASDCRTVFLPFLYGSIDGNGRGAFLNMDIDSTREDMVRAVMEGVAFAHRVHIERLRMTDDKRTTLKIAGGAVKSPIWMKIFADILGMTVVPVTVKESGCLGAAAAASVAAGIYGTVEEAAEKMSRIGSPIEPDMAEHEKYAEKYGIFKKHLAL